MLPSRLAGARLPALVAIVCVIIIACACSTAFAQEAAHDENVHGQLGERLPLWSIIPFAGILLSIALFPLFAPHWWHHNLPKVSLFWALLFGVPFIVGFRGEAMHEILHVYMLEYIPFIILLWALFTISGGILVKGTLNGSPMANTVMLLIGTLIASWVGTTGASMILIRPMIRANSWRRNKVHVFIFFIFLISNIGGSLTPLGDPPLFLGFLSGVPFFWTLKLLPHMLVLVVPLLVVHHFIDMWLYRREEKPEDDGSPREPVRLEGMQNLVLLAGVVGAVLMSGVWHAGEVTVLGVHLQISSIVRDGGLIGLGVLSLVLTNKTIREANGFNWFPIQEVGYLFAGIFMTIIPALTILRAGQDGSLSFVIDALKAPPHYFWITGGLSAFLDNAPSYLTMLTSCLGKFYQDVPTGEGIDLLLAERAIYAKAISTGAVFFGALTFIGNAPNFMVKSICEEGGIRMPSFFGYMFKWSIPFLVPLFILVTWLFF